MRLKQNKNIRIEHDGQSWLAKPGAGEQRGHHIVVEAVQARLQQLNVNISSIDDSPVKVFTHAEHYGVGPNSLHNRMNVWRPNASGKGVLHPDRLIERTDSKDLANLLIEFYLENGYADQAKAVRGWCNKVGVTFTK